MNEAPDFKVVEKAKAVKNKGFATDIVAQLGRAAKNQTLTTPNCTLANQMYVKLDYIVHTEGIEKRFARHLEMQGMVHDFVLGLPGFELLAPAGHRSPTLTAVRVPAGVTVAALKKVKETMRQKGYLFDPGYGKLNTELEEKGQRVLIRIGHMGDITPAMLAAYLDALKPELAQ